MVLNELGIKLSLDQQSVREASKNLNKKTGTSPVKAPTPKGDASAGLGGLGAILMKAIPIAALITLVKPIRQVLEVIGAVISIGLAPLLPLLRVFLIVAVWIFKKLSEFLGAGIEWIWANLLEPIWEGLKSAFSIIWDGLVWVWGLLKPAFLLYWEGLKLYWGLWKGVFTLIWSGLSWVWNNLLKPVFQMYWAGLTAVWNNLWKPMFTLIWEGLKLYWEHWKEAFITIWNGLKWVWNNVHKPVWEWLRDRFKSIWENIIKPVWNTIRSHFDSINNALSSIVNTIRNLLNRISSIRLPSFSRSRSVDDLIISPSGTFSTAPDDFIIATKDPNSLGGGTVINIKVDGFVGDEDLLAERIGKAIMSRNRGGVSQF